MVWIVCGCSPTTTLTPQKHHPKVTISSAEIEIFRLQDAAKQPLPLMETYVAFVANNKNMLFSKCRKVRTRPFPTYLRHAVLLKDGTAKIGAKTRQNLFGRQHGSAFFWGLGWVGWVQLLRKLLCMMESERDIQTYNIHQYTYSKWTRLVSDFNLDDPAHQIAGVRHRRLKTTDFPFHSLPGELGLNSSLFSRIPGPPKIDHT